MLARHSRKGVAVLALLALVLGACAAPPPPPFSPAPTTVSGPRVITVAATWGGFVVFAPGARFVTVSPEVTARLTDPMWLLAIFVVGPLLSVASVSAAVMVSSRSTDPRAAEQLAMVVIVPLLGLFFGQIAGLIFLNARLVAWMAGGLAVVDVGLLAFAVALFQRETILTRWR